MLDRWHRRAPRTILRPLLAVFAAIAMLSTSVAYADVGFDAASYQGCYNAHAAQQDGARFSFIKLSEGADYSNPYAGCQLTASRDAGLRLGAYHFADVATQSPQAEANNFLSVARAHNLIGAGVIPVLDWEPAGSLKTQTWWAKAWLDRVAQAWGTKPLIYMSASTISMADWSPVASADYGLWVAGYPKGYTGETLRNPGSVPYSVSPWPFAAAWQYSSSGYVSGVGNAVDVDWFYGDAATWEKYAHAPIDTVTHPATPNQSTNLAPVKTATTPTGNADILATAVIQGLYGNQPQREKLLGSRYNEIMTIVNQRLSGDTTNGTYYIVRSGDYLSKVWPQTWPAIAALNGLRNPYVIYVGQRIRTNGPTNNTSRHSIVINSGDTLWAHFGANSTYVARHNGISNPNRVTAGTRIYYY